MIGYSFKIGLSFVKKYAGTFPTIFSKNIWFIFAPHYYLKWYHIANSRADGHLD